MGQLHKICVENTHKELTCDLISLAAGGPSVFFVFLSKGFGFSHQSHNMQGSKENAVFICTNDDTVDRDNLNIVIPQQVGKCIEQVNIAVFGVKKPGQPNRMPAYSSTIRFPKRLVMVHSVEELPV